MSGYEPGDRVYVEATIGHAGRRPLVEGEYVILPGTGRYDGLARQLWTWVARGAFYKAHESTVHPATPTTSEIIAAIDDNPDAVEIWHALASEWVTCGTSRNRWLAALDAHGDQPQPGYRIVRGET